MIYLYLFSLFYSFVHYLCTLQAGRISSWSRGYKAM